MVFEIILKHNSRKFIFSELEFAVLEKKYPLVFVKIVCAGL